MMNGDFRKSKSLGKLSSLSLLFALAFGLCLLPLSSLSAQEVIKIGGIQPLTGWGAAEGNYVKDGAQIAVDQINEAGGIKGKKLKLMVEDGRNDPAESLNAAQKLINREKVSMLFGCWLSSATMAIIPTVQRYGVPFIVETSGYDGITHPPKKYVFRTSTLFSQEAQAAKEPMKKLGFQKIAFMAQDNDWGRGSVEEFSKVLKNIGAEVDATYFLDAATTDFYPQLTEIKNSDADAIIVVNSTPAVSKMLQQKLELGLDQKVLTTGGSNWPYSIVRMAGEKAAEGSYHLLFFVANHPETAPNPEKAKAYVQSWKDRDLSWDGVQEGSRGYDVILTMAEAIRLADGSADRDKLRGALEKVDIKGLTGHIKFDKYHDQNPNIQIVQVKDGETIIPEL